MKKIHLSRRALIRLVSYGSALMVILSVFAVSGWMQARAYQKTIEYDYQQAFAQLCSAVDSIDTALTKGQYATSPGMMSALSVEVSRQAADAGAALSRLPYSFVELENTARFLARVGDYSHALVKLSAYGQSISDHDDQNLGELAATAHELALQLATLQAVIHEEGLPIGSVLSAERDASQSMRMVSAGTEFFSDVESEFPEFPSLVYDGPFSAHMDTRQSTFLNGQSELTAEEAKLKAAEFLELMPEALRLESESGEKIPVYTFSGLVDGGELTVDVTRRGGFVLNLLSSRMVTAENVSNEQAIQNAREFLQKNGFKDMTESYWEKYNNTMVINFAYAQKDVVCYSDLVKVRIAMDTGKITGFESRGYLLNHTKRSLPEAKITRDAAQKNLSPRLSVSAYKQALIPTGGAREIFCHEFICKTKDGQDCLVYVNAETGQEERIMLLLIGENGTLAL